MAARETRMASPVPLGGRRALTASYTHTPPSPLKPLASDSPSERRTLFETVDNRGIMTIEAYLYRTDEYRSTTADFPFPLPLINGEYRNALNDRLQQGQELHSEISGLLERHNVTVQRMVFGQLAKPGYPRGGSILVLTLRVYSSHPDTAPGHQWSPATRSCQAFLKERGIVAEVEIIDERRAFMPKLLPIHPDDPYIAAYESFREALLWYVQQELGERWRSLCIYKVEKNLELGESYQIVLMVAPFTHKDWSEMIHHIRSTFIDPLSRWVRDMGVLIIPGDCSENDRDEEDSIKGKSFFDKLEALPCMGASMGVEGEKGVGSLGGFINLLHNGVTTRCLLTNSHAVAPARTAPETKQSYHEQGVALDLAPEDSRRSLVHTMAVQDVNVTLHEAELDLVRLCRTQEEVDAINKEICDQVEKEEMEKAPEDRGDLRAAQDGALRQKGARLGVLVGAEVEKEFREMVGRSTTGIEGLIHACRNTKRLTEHVISICRAMPRPIGKVLYSTGRGLNEAGAILDFALVEINKLDQALYDHSGRDNDLPQRGQIPNSLQPYAFKEVDGLYPFPEKPTGLGNIKKGEWYFKKGRTTGITVGTCHGTEVFVKLASHRSKYDAQGSRGEYRYHTYSRELVIIPSNKRDLIYGDIRRPRPFVEDGDSGSLIIDRRGYVAGLLFGSITGLCGPRKADAPPLDEWTEDEKPHDDIDMSEGVRHLRTLYAESSGLVMSFDVIEDHLRITEGAHLSLPHLDESVEGRENP